MEKEIRLLRNKKKIIILERLEYVEKDIKNLENFAAGQFANKVKANKKPIDVKDEEFQKELNATIEKEKNQQSKTGGVNAVISLKATLTDLREYLVEKGVLPAVSDGKDFEVKIQGLSRTKPINFLPKFHWGFYNQKSFLACYLKSQQYCQDLFV